MEGATAEALRAARQIRGRGRAMKFPWSKNKPTQGNEPKGAGTGQESPASSSIRPEDYVGSDPIKNEAMVRAGFVAKAKKSLRHIPLADEVVAMYFCLLDGRTPIWVKGIAAAALAYFILPLDAVPDLLPFVGLTDDLSVLSAALAAISSHLTPEHRTQARAWLRDERIIDVTPSGSRH
jgi:uncharacterized membrane protein YkvA (DUF1232 family)